MTGDYFTNGSTDEWLFIDGELYFAYPVYIKELRCHVWLNNEINTMLDQIKDALEVV